MKHLQAYTVLLLAFLGKQAGATSDTLLLKRLSDSLLLHEKHYEASVYYQKLDFLLQGEALKTEARLSAAHCYKLMGNYKEGIRHLNTIPLDEKPDSVVFKVKYQCALMNYLDNDLPGAESFLQQLEYLVKDSSYILRSGLLYVLVLNEQYRWPEARAKLLRLNSALVSDPDSIHRNRCLIDSMYDEKLIPKLKNRNKAAHMSMFVPGLGQCYAKSYGEGITSFLSVSVCAGAMLVGIVYQYYFTSIFVGNLLISKFYQGGIKRAEFLTDKYNYKKSREYNSFLKLQIRNYLNL
jgi:hypothetical protein